MLRLLTTVPLAVSFCVAMPAWGASLQPVTSFGANPTNAKMFVYAPDKKIDKPPILVVSHYCSGTASAMFTGTGFKDQADLHGFIVIYPQTTSSDGCWDVHSTQSLSHDGGGDSNSIVNMVKYAITQYSADAERVYATGTSSGAMMTNVLLGAYPEVFRGGAIFAGVPYACFAGTSGWNSACADGMITKTAAEWGNLVRAANPSYAGYRPRVQIWHGTSDETLDYKNFAEEIKQWTNVLGVSQTPSGTEMNQPQSGFTRTRYPDAGGVVRVEAVSEANQPHSLIVPADQVVKFFGLDATSDPGVVGGGTGGGLGAGGMGAGGMAGRGGGPLAGAGGVPGVSGSGSGAGAGGSNSAGQSGAGGGKPGAGGQAGRATTGQSGTSTTGGTTGSGVGGAAGQSNAQAGGGTDPEPTRPIVIDPPMEDNGSCSMTRGGGSTASSFVLALAGLALLRRRWARR